MSSFAYVALDPRGRETRGILDAANQLEALRRIKEMGFFPSKLAAIRPSPVPSRPRSKRRSLNVTLTLPGLGGRVKPRALAVFTRQLATLLEAGMPLLRGLRILEEQESNSVLKRVISEIVQDIESGTPLSDAMAQHPKTFTRLYINMVKAGELGGVLEITLKRLAEFMEKAEKIKGKIVAGMFYPIAVVTVAIAVVSLLMVFVVPRFREVFSDLMNGQALPAFTLLVLGISDSVKNNFPGALAAVAATAILFALLVRTRPGRRLFDLVKLRFPIIGPVISKAAIARFARTLGTLVSSGVPILQALTIVRETAGNVVVGDAVLAVHESVKEGETITQPLKASGVFPSIVVGMVDVGEQTGALPEMLMKIADTYDDEVDNSVGAMTSLIEPIMIVFLAVLVGSIVIAMFLPLIEIIQNGIDVDRDI